MASTSRSLGGAVVTRLSSSCLVMWAISETASSKVAWLAWDGLVVPAILRTYCSAAAVTSSLVAGGSKLLRGRMLRHMQTTVRRRSEEHTSEIQSLMRISYAVFCLKKKHH